jgi:hypothetical protein
VLSNFYKKSEPVSFISLLLLLFAYTGMWFYNTSQTVELSAILTALSLFVFYVALLFLANHIISSNKLSGTTHYALFVFVIFIGLFNDKLILSKVSFSHFFILLALLRIYSLYSKKRRLLKLFDAGFFIGISFLLYPLSILFFMVLYVAYALYIKRIEKTLLLPIIGFLTPIFIAFSYFFVFGNMQDFANLVELNIVLTFEKINTTMGYIWLFGILLILLIYAIINNMKYYNASDKENKISIKLITFHLLISILILFFYSINLNQSIQYLFLPAAVLIGNMIDNLSKIWQKETILLGLLILSFSFPFLFH